MIKRNLEIYNNLSQDFSRKLTEEYSSSFSAAASLLGKKQCQAIYNIYGFVRIADEIVDSWRPKDMNYYLDALVMDVKRAIKYGFSTNPIVHSFCVTLREYGIPFELVDSFIRSMKMDVTKKNYDAREYKIYIYGSAEVVGLMCLMVFVDGNKRQYNSLMPAAKALGSAFQKINFLRDFASDSKHLGRMYFPGKDIKKFSEDDKQAIVADIRNDLQTAHQAIKRLPKSSRFGVELAYKNFKKLTNVASSTPIDKLKNQRISLARSTKVKIYTWIKIKSAFIR